MLGVLAGVGQVLICRRTPESLPTTPAFDGAPFLQIGTARQLRASARVVGSSIHSFASSFACAIPGIMATRTIQKSARSIGDDHDRALMTCSARLPVYALIIGACHSAATLWGGLELQGVCCLRSTRGCRERHDGGICAQHRGPARASIL